MTEQTTAGRIVVGVDGSPGSRAALAWASRQAELTGATVAAWQVLRHPASLEWTVLPTNYGGAPLPIVFDRGEVLSSAERSLAELVAAGARPPRSRWVRGRADGVGEPALRRTRPVPGRDHPARSAADHSSTRVVP